MIDLKNEEVFPLSRAARLYPGGGRHVSALHRYRMDRDVPLECLKVGGVWMTTVEAMQRHVYALTEAELGTRRSPASTKARVSKIEKAKRTLEAAGI